MIFWRESMRKNKIYFLIILLLVCVTACKKVDIENINDNSSHGVYIYTYKGEINAEGIEIDKAIEIDENKPILENIELIKNQIKEDYFTEANIDIISINEDALLTVNLLDGTRAITEYLDMGTSGSKISLDILKYSFLQNESEIEPWISEVKFLVNGEENVEGNHFNLNGTFKRNKVDKILGNIKTYGYTNVMDNYDDEYVYSENGEKFGITFNDAETQIIINELIYQNGELSLGNELYRGNKSLLLTMDLSESIPSICIRLKKGDKVGTWLPSYNEKSRELVLPYEITSIQNKLGVSRKCPAYGANMNINQSGKCEYCGAIFNTEDYDWGITKIVN